MSYSEPSIIIFVVSFSYSNRVYFYKVYLTHFK